MRTIPKSSPTGAEPEAAPGQPRPGQPGQLSQAAAPLPWRAAQIMDDPTTAGVLHSAWSGDPAVVVPSPPGAGKTRLVALLAATLADRADLRVGVAAQTRQQAIEIASRLGHLSEAPRLIWPAKSERPQLPGTALAVSGRLARFATSGGGVVIATTARWLYANPSDLACDLMIVDEAWQATYADLGALGAFAPQIVCVGDPGQIEPVVTGQTRRWADDPAGPHRPSPAALLAAHRDAVSVVTLKHTWRLGADTTALIQPAFYPGLPFTSRRPPEHLTTSGGQQTPEVTYRPLTCPSGPTDPNLLTACANRVRELLTHSLTTPTDTRPLRPEDVAVICSHVAQAAVVRALLADLPSVLIGTANQLQGMERAAAVALHPLAGYRVFSGFAADPGRTCVMFSRHRAHLTVIGDVSIAALLAQAEPVPTAIAHRRVLAALET